MAERINYSMYRGDSTPLDKFNILDKDGNVLELTENDKIYFTLKSLDNDTALVKKSIGNGITLGDDDYYHIMIEPEDTEELDVDKYRYDIECDLLIDNKSYVKTLYVGNITLKKDVTLPEDRGDDDDE